MHSLKELRAENAARRLSNNQIADEDEGERTPFAEAAATPSAPATAAPARAGRTLAPLGSAGSSLPPGAATPTEPAADDGAQQQEDREERRQRRLRRRREREQREKYDDSAKDNGKVNNDNAKAASDAGTPGEEESGREAGGRGAEIDVLAGGKDRVQPGTGGRLERKRELPKEQPNRGSPPAAASFAGEEKVSRDAKSSDRGVDGDSSEKQPLSARGAPPSEKPRKNLTPLEARRARIEQQKREEVEQDIGLSNQSPRSVGSGQPREAVEVMSDTRSEGGPVDIDGRRRVDERISRIGNSSGDSRAEQLKKRDNSSGRGGVINQTRKSEDGDIGGIDSSSPFVSDGGMAQRQSEAGNNNKTGDQAESAKEGDPAKSETPGPGDANELGAPALGRGADDILEDPGNGDGGRFQGMRSRMKKAGKSLMTKKGPASTARGEKEGDDEVGGGTREKNEEEEEPDPAKLTSSEGTLPDTGDERRVGRARMPQRNEGDGSRGADRRSRAGVPADDSDIEGEEAVPSPIASEAGNEADFDTASDASDKGKGGKKWGRNKDKASADLPPAGDKEVTLGHVVDRKMREMGYIRKPPVDELKNRRSLRDRVAAEEAPEVHFIGEISGAEGFGPGISCRFRVEGGRHWTCLAGLEEGQTHVMDTSYGETFAPWNHPIDLHYTTKSIQVWQLDAHGRNVLRGYGFRHLPSTPGFSEVSVPCWRPSGTMQEETAAFFLGVTPRLAAEDAVFNRAWDQRCRLVTLPAGTVWMQMNGLFRNMQNQGVDII